MFEGLRTVVYHAPDLDQAKAWWSRHLGIAPYFDQPFYVGFNVAGYELGLFPDAPERITEAGSITYWGVKDIAVALQKLVADGAAELQAIQDVGEGIKVATVVNPAGQIVGIIENPHFSLPAAG